MLLTALRLRQLNISLCPILPQSKSFDTKAMKARGYKLAYLRERLPSKDDLAYWFGGSANRNMAAITNPNLLVADFDSEKEYQKFKREYPQLHYTYTVASHRGFHLYYQLSEPVTDDIISTWDDVELKHSGAAILSPPSIHPDGAQYRIVTPGLLNPFTILRITNAKVLPFVAVKKTPSEEKKLQTANSLFTGRSPIAKIKSALPITNYLEYLGCHLVQSGDGKLCCRCPVHNGKSNTSMWIDPVGNVCNCFDDRCRSHKPMDILDLYRKLNNCTLGRAIFELGNLVGV